MGMTSEIPVGGLADHTVGLERETGRAVFVARNLGQPPTASRATPSSPLPSGDRLRTEVRCTPTPTSFSTCFPAASGSGSS
jgi:hypothetical protein